MARQQTQSQYEQWELPEQTTPPPTGVLLAPNGATTANGEAQSPLIVENRGIAIGKNGYIRGSQSDYNTGTGFFLGYSGSAYKFSIGDTTNNYITFDGTTLTVKGTLSVSQLNIPDSTTANSMHVDSSGNTWWGANVASGYASAPASVLKDGSATFTNGTFTGALIASNNTFLISLTAGESITAGHALQALPYPVADVIFDSKATGLGTGTTTSSFTVGNNSNRMLIVFAQIDMNNTARNITGITYNGVSMTAVVNGLGSGTGDRGYMFMLAASATGANNIVISTDNVDVTFSYAIYSYYNVNQTVAPANSNGTSYTSSSSQTFSSLKNGSIILATVM